MNTEQSFGTITSISSDGSHLNQPYVQQKLVKVKIKYPETYAKPKLIKDGAEVEVSEETAKIFVDGGIGTIIDGDQPAENADGKKPVSRMNKAELIAALEAKEIEFDPEATKAVLAELLTSSETEGE